MKNFQIIRAEKHVKMIEDGLSHAERAEYLTLRAVDETKLRHDIKNGAVFLEGVDNLLNEKRAPRVMYIHTGTEEMGLIALNWLEEVLRKKSMSSDEFESEFDDDEIDFDDELEIEYGTPWGFISEDPKQVPLIPWDEITSYFNDSDDSYGVFGGNAGLFAKSGNTHAPYWVHCNVNPVCIVQRDFEDYLIGPEVLEQFSSNSRVYIMRIDPTLRDMACSDEPDLAEDDFPFGSVSMVENMRKNIVICNADYVKANMLTEQKNRYYCGVLRQVVSEHGFRLDLNMNIDELTQRLIDLSDDGLGVSALACGDFIEKAVCHVIERKKRGKVMKEEDFRYLFSEKDAEGKGISHGWDRLDKELVGMEDIKRRIRGIVNNFKFERIRKEKGLESLGYHNVFMMLGAPGTSKTTITEILGDIMAEEKLLKGRRFISVNGAELKGKYVGWTTEKVKQLFAQYDIIFVDEAYSLVSTAGDSDEFSQEAVAQLCIELEKHAQDRLVIFAGYGGDDMGEKGNLMKHFLDANPGITSRINSTIFFPSYTADEMVEIFHKQADIKKISLDRKADEEVRKYFEWRRKAKDFGNGREARSLFEAAIMKMSERVSAQKGKLSVKTLNTMKAEDVRGALEEKRMVANKLTGKTKALGFVV